jgi:hypothetical protein
VSRLIVLSSLVAVACMTATAATSSSVVPLPTSNLLWPEGGKATPLRAGVTYQANRLFPIPIRLTPPDGSWSGAQWRTSWRGCHHSKKPPYFGWVGAVQTPSTPGAVPRGAITIVTSYTRTRSATATANYLRTRGHGATYEPTSQVTVAAFSGLQFDGTIIGRKHVFVPFTPQSVNARCYGDAFNLEKGGVFRIIVLQVRTKTVVVFIEGAGLPPDQFPDFLPKADSILKSLKFPR